MTEEQTTRYGALIAPRINVYLPAHQRAQAEYHLAEALKKIELFSQEAPLFVKDFEDKVIAFTKSYIAIVEGFPSDASLELIMRSTVNSVAIDSIPLGRHPQNDVVNIKIFLSTGRTVDVKISSSAASDSVLQITRLLLRV